jgi:hypothetical protein
MFAALVTGLTMAVLLLAVKALFFYADNGYRDESAGGPITCASGPECVYQRYVLFEDGARVPELEAAGVVDVDTFTAFYWSSQFATAGLIILVTTVGGLGGAAIYGITRPKQARPADEAVVTSA